MIQFDEIPATNEVPNSLTEVQSSGPSGAEPKKVLIIGQRLAGGGVDADVPFAARGETSGDAAGGRGSQVGDMVRVYRELDPTAEVDGIGLDDDESGVAASGAIGITGTATASGELALLIGGKRSRVGVPNGTAAADVLTSLKAAIDADEWRYVTTGAIAADAFPVTCRWKGPSGNDIEIHVVSKVPGLTVEITDMADGATAPSLDDAIAAVASGDYDTVVLGLSDVDSLEAIEAELERRFGPVVEMSGSGFYGVRVTKTNLSTVISAQANRNSQHAIPISTGGSPTPPWIFAAQAAARDTTTYARDPGIPRADQTLPKCIAPAKGEHLEHSERSLLLAAGVSTFDVVARRCQIERLVTSYKRDAQGQPDRKFREVTTMRIIQDYRRKWRRHSLPLRTRKLIDDGTPVKPGIRFVTPGAGKAMMDAFYADYATTGNVQQIERFIEQSRCERHPVDQDRNRLDFFHPVRVGDIVITVATAIQIQ